MDSRAMERLAELRSELTPREQAIPSAPPPDVRAASATGKVDNARVVPGRPSSIVRLHHTVSPQQAVRRPQAELRQDKPRPNTASKKAQPPKDTKRAPRRDKPRSSGNRRQTEPRKIETLHDATVFLKALRDAPNANEFKRIVARYENHTRLRVARPTMIAILELLKFSLSNGELQVDQTALDRARMRLADPAIRSRALAMMALTQVAPVAPSPRAYPRADPPLATPHPRRVPAVSDLPAHAVLPVATPAPSTATTSPPTSPAPSAAPPARSRARSTRGIVRVD